ncbi:MAG: formate dehydrogenase accessory sulfurtransferase FdhD [Proteobacteria bacterium]|nr:formate dehydrogenase accessory sulfurtransferase FdhD [Pseudomonadota bacterium]MBU1388319.1 formate dehydrogenase accessory sulfurtransferase FdhD [Pseudomonadota bacterium]MBU1542863.1 formate dehydrogenase accessory sulfurtransferase FdhD [Pseudomonadota bacterium]MBU2431419.1 formate dehydrogenase accessory sulfurtransferase FdhD [Pseudomonadota bacterium]MBU2483069.1 formate dehydrogenase accessory sulfurtransferase FdhD [Pseudomonadota bacterium]
MNEGQPHQTLWIREKKTQESLLELIGEEPLSIRVQGNPYAVIMRTSGNEIAHAAGFCLGEGLVDSLDDFGGIAYCEDDVNVVTVTVTPERKKKVQTLLLRQGYTSQTSCGICGKALIEDMVSHISKVVSPVSMSSHLIRSELSQLSSHQPLRDRTRASHGAVLFGCEGNFLASGEDVGRHNALDKVVGKLFLDKRLHEAALLIMSSRISYELVQKAARAKIPIIAALSRPTALAVKLSQRLNITLVCADGKNGLYVFSGHQRVQ